MVTQTLTATDRATSNCIENRQAMLVSTAPMVVNVALGSVVPLPADLLLILTAFCGLAVVGRRRREATAA
jgi:hypothetical protein